MPNPFTPESLTQQVKASTGGQIVLRYDDKGYPSYMRRIPKFSYEDLPFSSFGSGVCTAFIVGGVEVPWIEIGQYQAHVYDGRALSLPGKAPTTNIDYDESVAACTAKGPGWHLMTAHEWAAIALWCMANDFEPRGSTDYGRAYDALHESGVKANGSAPGENGPSNDDILTGSGPASWRHDGTVNGIADMVGNVWEWQHGVKFVDGQIVCTEDNDFDKTEVSWTETGHWFSDESGTPTLGNSEDNTTEDTISVNFGNIAKASGYSESLLLKRLLISPADAIPQGRFYIRTKGERIPRGGGSWNHAGNAGLAARAADSVRSSRSTSTGFRPAFVEI